jgi:hypothetical protein
MPCLIVVLSKSTFTFSLASDKVNGTLLMLPLYSPDRRNGRFAHHLGTTNLPSSNSTSIVLAMSGVKVLLLFVCRDHNIKRLAVVPLLRNAPACPLEVLVALSANVIPPLPASPRD